MSTLLYLLYKGYYVLECCYKKNCSGFKLFFYVWFIVLWLYFGYVMVRVLTFGIKAQGLNTRDSIGLNRGFIMLPTRILINSLL